MSRIIAILIANFFVVDYGVIPDGKDNSVYVIQIEPEVAGQLVEGYVIESAIPPELRGIRKFRIQIGNEKLTKSAPLIVVPEDDGVEVPEDVEAPNEVLDGEASDVDIDAFPLRTDPVTNQQTEPIQLIPDDFDAAELPGVAVGSDTDAQVAHEVLEPEVTLLPQLSLDPVKIEVPTGVTEPQFDNVGTGVVAQTSEDIDQSRNAELDFADNDVTNDRIVLEELPDFETSPDENSVANGLLDSEPKLLRDNESEFVRLASSASSDADVANHIPNVSPKKPTEVESRSWPLFSITLLGLLVSVGGNVYLAMTVFEFYRKRNDTASGVVTPKETIYE
jgi:hypothetical protein